MAAVRSQSLFATQKWRIPQKVEGVWGGDCYRLNRLNCQSSTPHAPPNPRHVQKRSAIIWRAFIISPMLEKNGEFLRK
jgi:hypothetical protein